MADFTLAGLAGLNTVDPAVTVVGGDEAIEVRVDGAATASLCRPADNDPTAWARLAVAVIERGRTISPVLAEADAEALFQAVFDGALAQLDNFSRYAGAVKARNNRAFRVGFGGIGMTIRMEETDARILSVIENAPAGRAGIKIDDLVIAIDDIVIAGLGPATTDRHHARQGRRRRSADLVARRCRAQCPLGARKDRSGNGACSAPGRRRSGQGFEFQPTDGRQGQRRHHRTARCARQGDRRHRARSAGQSRRLARSGRRGRRRVPVRRRDRRHARPSSAKPAAVRRVRQRYRRRVAAGGAGQRQLGLGVGGRRRGAARPWPRRRYRHQFLWQGGPSRRCTGCPTAAN